MDSGQIEVQRVRKIFAGKWAGVSALAAAARIGNLGTNPAALIETAETVKKALVVYVDEIDAIKSLADEQIRIRSSAQASMRSIQAKMLTTSNPVERQSRIASSRTPIDTTGSI